MPQHELSTFKTSIVAAVLWVIFKIPNSRSKLLSYLADKMTIIDSNVSACVNFKSKKECYPAIKESVNYYLEKIENERALTDKELIDATILVLSVCDTKPNLVLKKKKESKDA